MVKLLNQHPLFNRCWNNKIPSLNREEIALTFSVVIRKYYRDESGTESY